MRIGNIFKRKVVDRILHEASPRDDATLSLSDIGDALYGMLIDSEELAYMKKKPKLFNWARAVTFKGRSLPLSKPRPFPSNVPELSDENSDYVDVMLEEFDANVAEEKEQHELLYAALSKCTTLKSIIAKEPALFPHVVAVLNEELTEDDSDTEVFLVRGIPVKVLHVLQQEGMCDGILLEYLRPDTAGKEVPEGE